MADEEGVNKKSTVTYHPPSISTLTFYTAIVVILIAIIIPIEFHYGNLGFLAGFDVSVPHDVNIVDYVMAKVGMKEFDVKTKEYGRKKEKIFTKEELLKFTGDSDIRYLAIIGEVFDVTKGKDHYGKEGGYKFFTGIDGSRAFITGKFDKDGLIDDIKGLDPQSYLGLKDWLEFYREDYIYVGKVVGYFYGPDGEEREGVQVFKEGVKNGEKDKENEAKEKLKFPECNSRWTQETGAHVWCATESGGVKRDWVGVPRKLFKPGQRSHRCVCVNEHLLDDPRLKEYDECDKNSVICKVPYP